MKKFIYSSMAVAMLASFAAAQETPWADKGCVAFVNGTKDYDQNCYNSGLENMKAGTCYTYNTLRGPVPRWINNQATETWWWVETPCVDAPIPPDPGPFVKVSRNCVEFVNGTQDYDQHCYSSGLENMKEGKCYTFNTARGSVPKWINNQASESWWWVEMDCEDTYYCSEHPEMEGCQVDPCEADPTAEGCQVDPCEADPTAEGCQVDPCEADPTAEGCEVAPVNCSDEANSDKEECAQYFQDKCIEFVNGKGNYSDNCYKSGLYNMEAGKCYMPNPARGNQIPKTGHMNNNAADAWWWVETECEKVYVAPVDMSLYDEVDKGCITYEHDVGGYSEHCYNAGLNGMEEGKCYVLNPDRLGGVDNAGYAHAINGNAYDSWWWVETSCTKYELKGEPKPEAKPEPKVAAGKIAVADKTLNVVSSTADVKTLRVFDMNGKLLHSESFSGMVKDVDFAKFAGKGVLLVRVTAGNKLVAMQRVSIR